MSVPGSSQHYAFITLTFIETLSSHLNYALCSTTNCSYLPSMRAFLQIRTIKKWKIAIHNMALVTYAKAKVVEDRYPTEERMLNPLKTTTFSRIKIRNEHY